MVFSPLRVCAPSWHCIMPGLTPPLLAVLMWMQPPWLLHDDSDCESMVDPRLLADVLDGVVDLGDLISTIVGKPEREHELDVVAFVGFKSAKGVDTNS
jgi:hypothetical protein